MSDFHNITEGHNLFRTSALIFRFFFFNYLNRDWVFIFWKNNNNLQYFLAQYLLCYCWEMIQVLAQVIQLRALQDREMKLVISCVVASLLASSPSFWDEHSPFLQKVTYWHPVINTWSDFYSQFNQNGIWER